MQKVCLRVENVEICRINEVGLKMLGEYNQVKKNGV